MIKIYFKVKSLITKCTVLRNAPSTLKGVYFIIILSISILTYAFKIKSTVQMHSQYT